MTEKQIRRLTLDGIIRAEQMLSEIDRNGSADIDSLLNDAELTTALDRSIEIRRFENRMDAAAHMATTLEGINTATPVERDKGLWTWLALAWMDVLAPDILGARKLGAHNRWVLAVEDYRKYYRHLLAGPFYIYTANRDDPERAMAVLATPVERPGELAEQFASRQAFVTSPGLMETVTRLYFDENSRSIKRGAASKGDGSARRLADVFLQLDLTWDINGMSADDLLRLLPPEFDRFKGGA